MSDPEEDSVAPWGYLLPMCDGFPPLELRQENETVGTADDCTQHIDATLFGQPPDAAPQVIFSVLRVKSTGKALLRSQSDSVRLDGKEQVRWKNASLQHGAHVDFGAGQSTYVFVNSRESDTLKAPSDELAHFLVGHSVGSGTYGKVSILFDKKSNYQRKAMKVVEPKNDAELQYAAREARILQTLKHPCVIQIFRSGEWGRRLFLVMEYMGGGDLRQYVKEQRVLSEAQAKLFFFQLVLAVQYLHNNNICHRDLKPANILLHQRRPKTLIKVTDFGLAKNEKEDSSMKSLAGSRHYVAPEIMEETGNSYTNSVDVWSLGVILFCSLTGTLPFKSVQESIIKKHEIKYDKEKWGEAKEAKTLVKSMLKVKAADRVSLLQVIDHPWLCDDTMREDVYKLTGLKNYRPGSHRWSDDTPWGYLLPLRDGPPPLELRLDCTTVGTDSSSNLLVDAAVLGLPTPMKAQVLFVVRRDRYTDSATLRCEADVIRLNGKVLQRGQNKPLQHAECIGFKEQEASYVFVSQEESNSFIAPPIVLEENLVGHCIGKGKFGKVHILFEKRDNYRRRAMKIVQLPNAASIKFSERQAPILKLKHPCFIEVFSVTELNMQHFLIMEYIGGGNLTQFVNDQRLLSEAQTRLIFFQIALAVKYLHDRNISYCILAPENIMLKSRKPDTLIKLSSFDLLKRFTGESMLDTWAVSPYVAPEITAIEESYPGAVDIWSMGVILFYSLNGDLPFKSRQDIGRRALEKRYGKEWRGSWLSRVLVQNMLKKEVAARLTISQVLKDPWLSDDAMREAAFRLTGLEGIRLQPSEPFDGILKPEPGPATPVKKSSFCTVT